jgi:preprotein translocase subunit SecE
LYRLTFIHKVSKIVREVNSMAEANANKKSLNPFKAIARYFREVKSEMKKVVWPSRKQVVNNTLVVIAAVLVIGIIIWE